MNPRYLAPPTALVGVVAGVVVGVTLTPWALLLPAGYAGVVLIGTATAGRGPGQRLPLRARALLPVVLPTMHLSWGAGFLAGVARGAHDTVDTSRLGDRNTPLP